VSCFAPTVVRPSVVVGALDVDAGVGAGVLVGVAAGGSVGVVRVGVHVAVGVLVGEFVGVLVGRGVGVAVGGLGVGVHVGVQVGVGVSVARIAGNVSDGKGRIWASAGRAVTMACVVKLPRNSTTATPPHKRAVKGATKDQDAVAGRRASSAVVRIIASAT